MDYLPFGTRVSADHFGATIVGTVIGHTSAFDGVVPLNVVSWDDVERFPYGSSESSLYLDVLDDTVTAR